MKLSTQEWLEDSGHYGGKLLCMFVAYSMWSDAQAAYQNDKQYMLYIKAFIACVAVVLFCTLSFLSIGKIS